jgi:predicted small lipoprotein YifL
MIYLAGKIKKGMLEWLLIGILLCISTAGCGRKAPPKPPNDARSATADGGVDWLWSQMK